MEIEYQINPLSVNKVWRGRRYKTPEYEEYERELLLMLPKKEMIFGYVSIDIVLYFNRPNNCDLDNPIKPILDIITKKGYIEDDRKIYELSIKKEKREKAGFKIKIEKYGK